MTKKLFTLLLTIAASVGTMFASNTQVNGIWYDFDSSNRTATVTYRGASYSAYNEYTGSVVIPASVSYGGRTYSVTSIGNNAFSNCSSLTSVTIPNSVKSIETGAFRECTALKSVTIPSSVTSIGGDAFNGCSRLTSVTIPNSVTSIGERAFGGCSGMTSVRIGNSVTSIGYAAFYGCSGLTSVTIPNSVTSIVRSTFEGCTGLTSVTIPSSVTSIGERAFYGCTNLPIENNIRYAGSYLVEAVNKTLSSYSIKTGTKWIGSAAFENCSNLCSITIPNSVTSIGYAAFRDCRGLTSIEIPNSVTSIDDYAFYGCSGLTSVTIPNSVTSIGGYAFSGCTGLFSVEIPNSVTNIGNWAFYMVRNIVYTGSAGGSQWGALSLNGFVDGYMVYKDATKTELLSCSLAVNGEVVIPNIVTSIGVKAFSGCSGLNSVAIPNSVTSIGEDAFAYCSSLTSVTLNSNAIVSQAYSRNYGLKSIFGKQVPKYIIGDSVTSIGAWAFAWCDGLTSVTIGNSVKSIGESAFYECGGLTSVTINSDSVTNNLNLSNIFGPQVQQYIIGSDITGFGNNVFQNCNSLTSILVDDSNSIYDSRNNCNAIIETSTNVLIRGCKNTIIPDEVTSIGSWAFAYCSGLTSISLDNNITSIGEYAFYKSGLTSVTIDDNITNIGGNAFSGCSALTSVVWNHKNGPSCNFGNQVTSFTFGNDVEVIPASICAGMTNLTSITIPNSVTSIGENAFKNCNNLTSVTIESESIISKKYTSYENNIDEIFGGQVSQYIIGDGITTIGDYAFYLCSGLTSVTIPNSVTSIGYRAFQSTNINIINFTGTLEDWLNKPWSQTSVSGNYKLLLNGVLQESIIFPNNVTSIGDNAFQGCSGLTSVTIPNSVNNIGSSAFQGCSGLTSVTIGNSVTNIGNNAFYGCNGLTSVTIPNSVTNIGNNAFYGCNGLTSVTISNSVTSIGEKAFAYCSGLTSIEIPNSVTSIGNDAFRDCSGLTSVTIPNSVTSIGGWAFINCTGLTSVRIGNSVTSIGPNAFYGCSGLTKVNITDIAFWLNINFISNSFGDYYSNPLYYARNLYVNDDLVTDLVIPNSVTSIGGGAFYGCTGLTSVTIPNSVTSIGSGAFSGCTGLTSVTCLAPTPPTCRGSSCFSGVNCSNIPLYVPMESVSLYQAANIWKEFNVTGVMFADEVETAVFSATPTDDYGVILEWQAVENAVLYNIDIIQGNDTIRKLQFDSNGKLRNSPSNAPSRYPNIHHASAAILSGNGWRYEVNDLDPGTNYTYSITVKAENGSVLYTQSIGFTTKEETFIIKFVNWNGEELLVLPEVVKGTTPSYTGETPVRPNTAEYTYTFVGWTPAIVAATSDTTYTATYTATKNSYTITWQNEDGSLIDQTTVEYGVVPTHADPTKEATAEYTYTFAGWTPAVVAVKGDATYKATFNSVVNVYTISASAVNGQVIGGGEYQYGATIDLTAIPNEGYVFDQWSDGVKDNPRTITVTGDAEYTALFTSTEGLENIYTSEPVQKVIIDQKVYILRGDKTYTLQGQVTIVP